MKLATFLLESADYSVISAVNAEAGLMRAREEHPDLILMDIQLPGMDGLQATSLLKGDDATRAIPVIALTALAMKGDEERIRAAGCDGYIAKPLDYKELGPPRSKASLEKGHGVLSFSKPCGAPHNAERALHRDPGARDRSFVEQSTDQRHSMRHSARRRELGKRMRGIGRPVAPRLRHLDETRRAA